MFYVLEALHPGVGLFGGFGTVALVLGGLFMLGVTGPPALPGGGLEVNRWLLTGVGAFTLLLLVMLAREFRLSHRQVYVSPFARERLLGEAREVSVRLAPRGEVRLAGEAWSAELRGASSADVGERVRARTSLSSDCSWSPRKAENPRRPKQSTDQSSPGGSTVGVILNFVKDYERIARFRFGRFEGMKGLGIVIALPVIHSKTLVDTRTEVLDIPAPDVHHEGQRADQHRLPRLLRIRERG